MHRRRTHRIFYHAATLRMRRPDVVSWGSESGSSECDFLKILTKAWPLVGAVD